MGELASIARGGGFRVRNTNDPVSEWPEAETRTVGRRGRHQFEDAAVRGGNAECDRQAEARDVAARTCRDEWLEDLRGDLVGHAPPVVGHFHQRVLARRIGTHDDSPAALASDHALFGVEDQIHDNLLHLVAVCGDERQRLSVVLFEVDVRVLELVRSQCDRRLHDFIEIVQHPFTRTFADERDQVANNLDGS